METVLSAAEAKFLEEQAQSFAQKIKSYPNPELLDACCKIIKKKVPLSTRKYLPAYFMLLNRSRRPSEPSRSQRRPQPAHKANTQALFVGIGKNQNVYPNDLTALFAKTLQIPPSSFGSIKIFKTYSFIEVPSDYCEQAIRELNGSEYRSVPLKVNFSRNTSPAP